MIYSHSAQLAYVHLRSVLRILVVADGLALFASRLRARDLEGEMGEPAIFLRTVPVLVARGDLDDVAGREALRGLARLLVPALGFDELLQLDTGYLKFISLKPALTLSSVIVWKKYRLLSKSSSVFLEELQKRVAK